VATDLLLLQFAREPRPGSVKTRMQPALSAEAACELHRELVRWTCRQLVESGLGPVELCVAGDTADPLFADCRALGAAAVTQQRGGDLGERMFEAISRGLVAHRRVILVGSDCPAISPAYLAQADAVLERVPVVLGPAEDGGYVLIGARTIYAGVFAGVSWGTGTVYAQTLDNLRAAGLAWESLPPLPDIDRPEDLAGWAVLRNGER
jgi:rSAM/selenodomain-associated transferase 1